MIYWLKEKFRERISIIVILTIILFGLVGGIIGSSIFRVPGFIIGAVIACLVGMFFCIITYGLVATVICIADSAQENTELLGEIKNKLNDVEVIKNRMNQLEDIYEVLKKTNNCHKMSDSNSKGNPASDNDVDVDEEYTIRNENGRRFAIKHGIPYCPKCHAVVDSETATMCSSCGNSFMA